jgi:hypothetical protein
MKYFSTVYSVGSVQYTSFIYAQDRSGAEEYSEQRNIGETVIGEHVTKAGFDPCPLPSYFYERRKLTDCVHTFMFYSWIASRIDARRKLTSGTMIFTDLPDELLRDDGILHQLIHEMHHPKHYSKQQPVLDQLVEFEHKIPGLKTFKL